MKLGCVVCYELFTNATEDIYTLPCGHLFHNPCVLQWFQQSKTCPHCRRATLESQMIRVHRNDLGVEDDGMDAMEKEMEAQSQQISTLLEEAGKIKREKASVEAKMAGVVMASRMMEAEIKAKANIIRLLKEQVGALQCEVARIRSEAELKMQRLNQQHQDKQKEELAPIKQTLDKLVLEFACLEIGRQQQTVSSSEDDSAMEDLDNAFIAPDSYL